MAQALYLKTSFWTDAKIMDEFTPDERFFYLYLMTTSQSNMTGCYEISMKVTSSQTGYTTDAIENYMDRLTRLDVIRYNPETHEVLILNYAKHNWSRSPKFLSAAYKIVKEIKCYEFKQYVTSMLIEYGFEASNIEYDIDFEIGYRYPIQNTVVVVDTDNTVNNKSLKANTKEVDINTINTSVVDIENNNNNVRTCEEKTALREAVEEIIDYLNEATGKHFSPKKEGTISHISARFKEGYKIEDFHTVIDIKARDWIGTEQEKYLRPETLFGGKFESYLNEQYIKATKRWERGTGRKYSNDPMSWEKAAEEVKRRRINGYDNRADCEIDQSDSSSVPELPFSVQ